MLNALLVSGCHFLLDGVHDILVGVHHLRSGRAKQFLDREPFFSLPLIDAIVRSHLRAFSGIPPEGALITEGFYINTIASPMMCE